MRVSKKHLQQILSEQEFSEMAYRPKEVKNLADQKPPRARPIWLPGNENDDMPDGWILNPNQIEGEEQVFMYLNGVAREEWEEANEEYLDQLKEKLGKDFEVVDKTTTKYAPRNKKTGLRYTEIGRAHV